MILAFLFFVCIFFFGYFRRHYREQKREGGLRLLTHYRTNDNAFKFKLHDVSLFFIIGFVAYQAGVFIFFRMCSEINLFNVTQSD
jgi:hypothetical protein